MVLDEILDIVHNLGIPPPCVGRHLRNHIIPVVVGGGGLAVQDERDREEALRKIVVS